MEFVIDEILYGVAQNMEDELLYTLDQLSSAEISIDADSTDITDKNGNIVRTRYTSKTGTFTAKNAFLHPQIMNAASGSDAIYASAEAPVQMPKIDVIAAGEQLDVSGAIEGTIRVIGLYSDGSNADPMTAEAIAAAISEKKFTAPAAGEGLPIQYLVKYERNAKSGMKIVNEAEKFPAVVKMTLFCSCLTPCGDDLKPIYVYLPKFMPDPATTISLSRDTQEMDFNGKMAIDNCSVNKELYIIFIPDEDKIITGVVGE